MGVITRFAPSPTGLLHLGHAYSALQGWRAARRGGGIFRLRLEDIDRTRCRQEYADAIFEDLAWLGLNHEGEVRRQSRHLADYRAALERLEAEGLIYPCFCTRAAIGAERAPHGTFGPIYPGTCRALPLAEREARRAAGLPFAWRLDAHMAEARTGPLRFEDDLAGRVEVDLSGHGDVVLARKDTPTSYHLAVTVDDALQEVSLVTRGVDLLPATHIHRVLQALLGLPTPRYRHHRLLTDADGRRYAKRDRALTLASLRHAGHRPASVLAMIED